MDYDDVARFVTDTVAVETFTETETAESLVDRGGDPTLIHEGLGSLDVMGGSGWKGKGGKKVGKKGGKKGGKNKKVDPVAKRNEPGNVIQVAEAVAVLQGIPVEEVLRSARENVRDLFGI